MKSMLPLVSLTFLVFVSSSTSVRAQAKTPPYLNQFPTVERVKAEIKGSDQIDTLARQQVAFALLNEMIPDLAGERFDHDDMSRAEEELRSRYAEAFQWYQYKERAPAPQDQPRLNKLTQFYEKDPGFLDELLRLFFTPQFRTAYYRTTKKQPPGSSQSAQPSLSARDEAANAELGFPKEPTAVLTIANGFRDPNNKLNGMPIWLLDDSFGSLLRGTKLLDGPPGATVKVTPLRIWATSCFSSSPVCQGMLAEVQGHIVGASKMDGTGRAAFQAVPPGSYYLLALTAYNQQAMVWDLRVDLKSGVNKVTLDPNNITPIDAEQALTGSKNFAAAPCNVTAPVKNEGPPNSTLSIKGNPYSLKVTNSSGVVVRTEKGVFSNTRFLLIDDGIESIWRNAGVRQFMGMSLMDSVSFYARLGDPDLLKNSPVGGLYNFIGTGLGADEMPKAFQALARGQHECAIKALRAHTIAEVTTDANARATFPKVAAGRYHLFGEFTHGHPLVWDLQIELKPGANTVTLSVENAAWKFGAVN